MKQPLWFAICWRVLFCSIFFIAAQLKGQAGTGTSQDSIPYHDVQSPPQFHMQVPLVVEDVVVLDRNNQPVHGLKAEDFRVTENGKAVELKNFEEQSAATKSSTKPPKLPDLGPNVFANLPQVAQSGSLNVLLLDVLNTSLVNQAYLREQILLYLKQLAPGTRIAIFGLGTRLYLLHGFTSDSAVLQAAIERKQGGMRFSSHLDNANSGTPGPALAEGMSDRRGDDAESAAVLSTLSQFDVDRQVQSVRERALYTLEALNELARYLSMLPGHKNVIWFSGSFPLYFLPDENLIEPRGNPIPFAAVADFENDLRQTANLLARSRVAVYPVDAQGLFINPAFSASQQGSSLISNATGPGSTTAANDEFVQQSHAERSTMNRIAEETGGKAFYSTNGMKEAVEMVINYGENYYTIAYIPKGEKGDGTFRKIGIKTDRPGLHLYYRKGYYADDPSALAPLKTISPQNIMQRTMLPGAPNANQVGFFEVLIPPDTPSNLLSAGAHPDAARMKPPYKRYFAQFVFDVRTMHMIRDDKGVYRDALELALSVYDIDGATVNSVVNKLNITASERRYQQLMKEGLKMRQVIETPAQGDYFLRTGVYDVNGARVGSLEVPLAGLKSRKEMLAAEAAKQ